MTEKSAAELLLEAGVHIPAAVASQAPQQVGIMDLMRRAFDAGNLELVERAMTLQERWEHNQARKDFERAMVRARGKIGTVLKNRRVDYTSPKGRVNYAYEDLAAVTSAVDEVIPELGLSYRFRTKVDGKSLTVTLVLSHENGYSEDNSLSAAHDESGGKNSIQGCGSTQTYLERYLLKAGFGLAAAEADDDGQAHGKPAVELASPQQIETLKKALEVREMKIDRLLKWARIKEIGELPASLVDEALSKIRIAGEPQ